MDDGVRSHALAAALDDSAEGREALNARLARTSAITVTDLVLDRVGPVRLRLACARSLAGRIPELPERRVAALAAHTCDSSDDAGVLTALVTALDVADTTSSRVLRVAAIEHGNYYVAHRLGAHDLQDRAARGDEQAVRLLAVLVSAPWARMRRTGEAAVDALIDSQGLNAVLAMLGAPSPSSLALTAEHPALRLLGLRLWHRSGGAIAACLGDEAVHVCRAAYDLLLDRHGDDTELWSVVEERRPGRLWALALLHTRGHAIRAAWESLGAPAVEVPGVPADVREAIVRNYAPGQADTDPRWLVEAALLPRLPRSARETSDERLRVALEALRRAGYTPQEPVPAGEARGSGHGTFHVIATELGRIRLSTLGPFYDVEGDDLAVPVLARAGFRHVDAELAAVTVPGLAVYHFGDRAALPVGTLLFYWQD